MVPRVTRPLHSRFPPIGGVLARAPVALPAVLAALLRAAGTCGWFAPLALLAALLDASQIPGPCPFAPVRWLELAAFAGLVAAYALRRREGVSHAWRTSLDGRLAAMLAVLLIAALPRGGQPWHAGELRIALAGVAAYYALTALVSRDPAARGVAWRTFPVAAVVLGLHALWSATSGLAHLAGAAAAADSAWVARHGLASATLLATMLTLGRALERGTPPAWRLAAVVGAIGTALHAAALRHVAAGAPVDLRSLARLEDPLDFSSAMVIALALHRLGRTAWSLRRERPAEAGRWWGAIAAVTLMGAGLLFGIGPPGEGIAVLAAVVAGLVISARTVPSSVVAASQVEPPARLARAA